MKKAEFVKMFKDHRERYYRGEVKLGHMRVSEAVMGMAEAEKEAGNIWRKHRATFAPQTVEQAKAFLNWKD